MRRSSTEWNKLGPEKERGMVSLSKKKDSSHQSKEEKEFSSIKGVLQRKKRGNYGESITRRPTSRVGQQSHEEVMFEEIKREREVHTL